MTESTQSEMQEVMNGAYQSPDKMKKTGFGDYAKFKPYADGMLSKWNEQHDRFKDNRSARKASANVKAMQADGKLKANHTYIGIRLIDTNIAAEIPPHVQYLKQSKRLGIFIPDDARLTRDASFSAEYVEAEFARVMTYPAWERPFIQLLDASSLHGFNFLEVLHDESKPGHCSINYVPCTDLFWDKSVDDIQSSRMVLRAYRITLVDLNKLRIKFGFDKKGVEEVRAKVEKECDQSAVLGKEHDKFAIYRAFYKDDNNEVQECWYAKDCDTWLKAPVPFTNGIAKIGSKIVVAQTAADVRTEQTIEDAPQTVYPYFLKQLRLTENGTIVQSEGRAEVDYYKQDAASATLSSFVNGCLDATNVCWAPNERDPSRGGTEPKTLTMELKSGTVWDSPMTAIHTPFPEATMLTAVSTIQTLNQVETSNIAYAVNNRKDSRKTATEVGMAKQESSELSGVQVLMFSLTLTEVLNYAWKIVQSAALQGKIMFCPDEAGSNMTPLIEKRYVLKPAGDVDFVERNAKVLKMQQDWPVISQTPLRNQFMEDYMKVRYPEMAEKYIAILKQANVVPQLLQNSMNLLVQAVTDEKGNLLPDWAPHAQELQQLKMQADQALAATGTQPQQQEGQEQ